MQSYAGHKTVLPLSNMPPCASRMGLRERLWGAAGGMAKIDGSIFCLSNLKEGLNNCRFLDNSISDA